MTETNHRDVVQELIETEAGWPPRMPSARPGDRCDARRELGARADLAARDERVGPLRKQR